MKIRKVEKLPGTSCNICNSTGLKIIIDAPTKQGSWAYMCEKCFKTNGQEPATRFELTKVEQLKRFSRKEEEEYASSLDHETLEAMVTDFEDVVAIDGCVVEPDGTCQHGYESPLMILGII